MSQPLSSPHALREQVLSLMQSMSRLELEAIPAGSALLPSEARALELLATSDELPMTINALCELLYLERTSVTRLCQRLERQGLLVRGTNARDARARALTLTDEGQALAQEIITHHKRRWQLLWESLDPLSQHTLSLALPTLARVMGAS